MALVYDRLMAPTEEAGLTDWRHELLGDLSGDVLEAGAGTGLNLAHYPPTLDRLVLTEPDPHMRRRLQRALAAAPPLFPAEVGDGSLDALPYGGQSFDAVVATLVLCSVRSPAEALSEVRRVLRPGGRLVFIEHVAATGKPRRLRWQHRLEPVWKRLAGNCHLTRDTEQAIEAAGFEVEHVTRESMRQAMPIVRPSIRGMARRP